MHKCIQNSHTCMFDISDKDECQDNNGGCEHDCADLVGGYLCKCPPGYKLHKDKHRCVEGSSLLCFLLFTVFLYILFLMLVEWLTILLPLKNLKFNQLI